MEVILKENHPHLGEKGEIVQVAAGYARNYLIPKNMAVINTPGNRAAIKAEGQFEKIKLEKEKASAEQVKDKIQGKEVKIKAKAGKDGKLYGSITKQDIAALLEKEGYLIDKKIMEVEEHIREIGSYEIQLNLHRDVKAYINLIVEKESSKEEESTDAVEETSGKEEESSGEENSEGS
jgi:large subunit ribosomal protein L9